VIPSEISNKIITEWLAEVGEQGMEWDDIADLEDRIVKSISGQWIPVYDRLPEVILPRKPYAGFWVYRPGSNAKTMWEMMHPSWWNHPAADGECPITAWLDWQPPEPPK